MFVSLPFVVREVVPVLREIGTEQEQAAATLGASRFTTFSADHPAVDSLGRRYGVVLTTARCLGEFGAVAIVSGGIDGKTQTQPCASVRTGVVRATSTSTARRVMAIASVTCWRSQARSRS